MSDRNITPALIGEIQAHLRSLKISGILLSMGSGCLLVLESGDPKQITKGDKTLMESWFFGDEMFDGVTIFHGPCNADREVYDLQDYLANSNPPRSPRTISPTGRFTRFQRRVGPYRREPRIRPTEEPSEILSAN